MRQVTGALAATVTACLAAGCGGAVGTAGQHAPPGPHVRQARPRTRPAGRPGRRLPYPQVLVFGYPSGHVSRVTVTQLDCERAVVTARGRSAELGFDVASDLFALSGVRWHARGPRAPRLVGLSAGEAVAAARRHHFRIYVDGGVIDQAAPFGSVVFQSLPAGLPGSGPGRDVGVIIGVRRSPACSAGQFAVSYLGGEAGAGNDFGTLVSGIARRGPARWQGRCA